ncbi:MAG: type II toxin-antitoxin system VapC family toxin [Micrococcales bacterium]|nr:type II toxin-antitoxin system VapC family toxin [Micrococcales bacterium]
MIGLDTNVVVRFLVGDDPVQTRAAREVFAGLSADNPGYLSLVVWVETFWVLTRTYKQAPGDVVAVLAGLLASDEIVSQAEAEVRDALADAARGADLGDALTARAARAAGCTESVTFDKKAAKMLGFRLL